MKINKENTTHRHSTPLLSLSLASVNTYFIK